MLWGNVALEKDLILMLKAYYGDSREYLVG